jgi:MoaA/NifB/PqqE/SkfB family radical SAM enzyme
MLQAYVAGVCSTGINFAGGEVLGNREDFFEILDHARSLDIPFRLNTNCWWARKNDFQVCGVSFGHPKDLIAKLQSFGMRLFAFSYDVRYRDSPHLAGDLIEAIRMCERAHIQYQMIFTGIHPNIASDHVSALCKATGTKLKHLIPVSMEMVDIGGAADIDFKQFRWQSNTSICKGRGFFRPHILHVSPSGDVRTCIYAVGLGNVGSLREYSFADLINAFPRSAHNSVFSDKQEQRENYQNLVRPYLDIYKPIWHECTLNIILAKTLEKRVVAGASESNKTHKSIAVEMNLLA